MRSFGTRSRADARVVQRVEGPAQWWRRPGAHRQRAARIFFEQRAQAVDLLQRGRRTGPCQSLSVGQRHLGHCPQRRREHQIGGGAVPHGQVARPPPSGRRPCACSSRSTPRCARPRKPPSDSTSAAPTGACSAGGCGSSFGTSACGGAARPAANQGQHQVPGPGPGPAPAAVGSGRHQRSSCLATARGGVTKKTRLMPPSASRLTTR